MNTNHILKLLFNYSILQLAMVKSRIENIFEAYKSFYIACKVFSFVNITLYKIDNAFKAFTSKFDTFKFIVEIVILFSYNYDISSTSIQPSARSIVFEILLSINGKLQALRPSLIALHIFFYRYEYLKIFKVLDWIDKKVKIEKKF